MDKWTITYKQVRVEGSKTDKLTTTTLVSTCSEKTSGYNSKENAYMDPHVTDPSYHLCTFKIL